MQTSADFSHRFAARKDDARRGSQNNVSDHQLFDAQGSIATNLGDRLRLKSRNKLAPAI